VDQIELELMLFFLVFDLLFAVFFFKLLQLGVELLVFVLVAFD
jgi:hypothetical protein